LGLDYAAGCVNFRDVGEFVNLIAGSELLPAGRLLRGGKLDHVRDSVTIGCPATIINLRKGPDPHSFGADCYQCAISNDYEKYDTTQPEVRKWLASIVTIFLETELCYPVLIHCTSGKDRTGVVVAALLRIAGVSDNVIIEEYLLSDGEVRREWIQQALGGMSDLEQYFRRIDLASVRRNLLGRPIQLP
jgi:protein-tyrosine phosphatase